MLYNSYRHNTELNGDKQGSGSITCLPTQSHIFLQWATHLQIRAPLNRLRLIGRGHAYFWYTILECNRLLFTVSVVERDCNFFNFLLTIIIRGAYKPNFKINNCYVFSIEKFAQGWMRAGIFVSRPHQSTPIDMEITAAGFSVREWHPNKPLPMESPGRCSTMGTNRNW
jgi:hypothetical protein